MHLITTQLAEGVWAVRHDPVGDNETFDWSVNVVLEDGGETIALHNFNPGPSHAVPGLQEWRAYARATFPDAKNVRFERRTRGRWRWIKRAINP